MAIVYVQSISGEGGGGGTSFGVTLGSNVTAGNLLVAYVLYIDNSVDLTSVTSPGATWSRADVTHDASTGFRTAIFYAPNVPAGATTVTANGAATSVIYHMAVAEYSGVAVVTPLDSGNVRVDAVGSTTPTSNNFTTGTNGCLVVCGYTDIQGRTVTVTAGTALAFTKREDFGPASRHGAFEDAIQSAAGVTHGDWSVTLDDNYVCAAAAFKAAAGAPAPPQLLGGVSDSQIMIVHGGWPGRRYR